MPREDLDAPWPRGKVPDVDRLVAARGEQQVLVRAQCPNGAIVAPKRPDALEVERHYKLAIALDRELLRLEERPRVGRQLHGCRLLTGIGVGPCEFVDAGGEGGEVLLQYRVRRL